MKNSYESYYLDYPLVTGRVFDVFMPEVISKEVSVFWVHGGAWRGGRSIISSQRNTLVSLLQELPKLQQWVI